jgi:hypothetical protein
MISFPWSTKPPYGTQLNWGHPMAAGLQWFAALNEGAGTLIASATGTGVASLTGYSASNPWVSTAYGTGLGCSGSSAQGINGSGLSVTGTWTLAVSAVPSLVNSAYHCLYYSPQFPSGAPSAIYIHTNNKWAFETPGYTFYYGLTAVVGTPVVMITSYTGGTFNYYFNGVSVGTYSAANTVYKPFTLGYDPFTQYFAGSILWAGLWNTAPSGLPAQIGGSPNAIWQMFQPVSTIPAYKASPSGLLFRRTLFDRIGSRGAA